MFPELSPSPVSNASTRLGTQEIESKPLILQNAPARIDYRDFFSQSLAQELLERRCSSDVITIRSDSGHDIRSAPNKSGSFLEYCCFNDDVLAVVSEVPNGLSGRTVQMTTDGDWLHLQFRLSGGGFEQIPGSSMVKTPTGSCAVIRSPSDSETLREISPNVSWSSVCLYMRPSSVSRFFGLSASSFTERFSWIPDGGQLGFRSHVMPIDARVHTILRDILSNPFEGEFRRTFLKAKTLELFAVTTQRLWTQTDKVENDPEIASSDYAKLKLLMDILSRDVETPMTLGSMARKIGTNRTRLSEMFKECNGITLQAYRRKLRLDEAMKLLSGQRLQVTEVAARVGYSVSSLSRAFVSEFGILPKDVRPRR